MAILSCGGKDEPTPTPPVPEIKDVPGRLVSIQEFGVLPSNPAAINKQNLQKAINEAANSGLALYVTPVESGYPMDGGLILKRNVSLIGAHGPTGRGTSNKAHDGPTGSVFVIRDKNNVFITVESATSIRGIQFYYPDQTWEDPDKIICYPATIQGTQESHPQGVTLKDLSFYGEYFAMDFRHDSACEQILFENCYGYPLSGQFIAIDHCYDIPRILHCHVNPANMRQFGRSFSGSVIDRVIASKKYTYWIDRTDNAVIMDVFTFGNFGGIYLGPTTYGQMTNLNMDCVQIGLYIAANGSWEIAQGCIFAYLGEKVEDIHPIVITGTRGHTTLTAIDCYTVRNDWIKSSYGASYDFLYLPGNGSITVSVLGCKMSGYVADDPITVENQLATVSVRGCFDRGSKLYEKTIDHEGDMYESGTKTVVDACDEATDWISNLATVTVDTSNKMEGEGCLSVTGKGVVLFSKKFGPIDAKVSHKHGHFHLWFYISDISGIDSNEGGQIEVTSSGTFDQNEYSWNLPVKSLKSGWNEIDLRFFNSSITGGNPDRSAMDFIRIYHHGIKKDVTIKLDDIYFYEE